MTSVMGSYAPLLYFFPAFSAILPIYILCGMVIAAVAAGLPRRGFCVYNERRKQEDMHSLGEKLMEGIFRVETVVMQMELLLRIILAGFCGGAIGYERESRKKTAGLRTHVIVAVSSALMIVLSKYGFNDVLGTYVRLDPSRIAAGTVTAIGFLGSGIIFSRNKSVSGVTTSAGIWATLGVGMAVGAGMYVIGIATTGIVVLVEIFIGRSGKLSYIVKEVHELVIEYGVTEQSEQMLNYIQSELEGKYGCKILKFQMKRNGENVRLEILVRMKKKNINFTALMEEYPEITKISI